MATEFRDAEPEVHDLLAAVIERHFPELRDMEEPLTFDVRMAVSDRDGVPPLRRHGHRCAARIEVVKAEERSAGGRDLRLKIDGPLWMSDDDETNESKLFHELCHVEPRREKDTGGLKLDPYGRPLVRLRPDDWMLTGFVRTVRAYGEKAVERRALRAVEEMIGQMVLPFGEPDDARVTISGGDKPATMTGDDFKRPPDRIAGMSRGRKARPAMAAAEQQEPPGRGRANGRE